METLSIVIPAYNEEDAIASTIQQCLAVREAIVKEAGLTAVEIIVVNDGSRDKTPQIAGEFKEITLINHEVNRGYGAALKTGFSGAKGEILGFMDADGTCDPHYFIDLCNMLQEKKADIVLGSRMGAGSQMPKMRRLGNRFYALVMSLISDKIVSDTASGMRVFRKEALEKLYPLPDGLHFTPAMSCKALLDDGLSIYEVPISYSERKGRSKLNVIKDGIRFLKVILNIALTYHPRKFFGTLGILFIILALIYVLFPVEYYLHYRKLEEGMIYRLISVVVSLAVGLNLISIGETAENFLRVAGYQRQHPSFFGELLRRIFSGTKLLIIGSVSILAGILLNYKTLFQYITTHHIYVHWSYVLTGGTLVLIGFQLISLGMLQHFVQLLLSHRKS